MPVVRSYVALRAQSLTRDNYRAVLDPLIGSLKQRGFCFRTLRDHPQYAAARPPLRLAAHGAR